MHFFIKSWHERSKLTVCPAYALTLFFVTKTFLSLHRRVQPIYTLEYDNTLIKHKNPPQNSPAVPELSSWCHLGLRTLNSVFLGS
jgi:hypothetical protein